jgi:hypothetical protein
MGCEGRLRRIKRVSDHAAGEAPEYRDVAKGACIPRN